MKKLLMIISIVLFSINYMMADITISVPKKWKGRTIYLWQTDINNVFNRQEDEPLRQLKDTIVIKERTFTVPVKLDCATKINILTPKKDETDYDHTIAEACVMAGEDVHFFLKENEVRVEGSLLNQQMAEIYSYNMQAMEPFRAVRSRNDKDEVARLARKYNQWFVDYIKANPSAPAAGYALYLLSNPKLVVELSEVLQGDALTSIFYPYAENHINRCKQILQRQESQASLTEIDTPNFTLNDISGNQVSLSDFKGKWVILDFWGSWCAPCIKGMPELKEIYETYAGRLEIIGVDCNNTEDRWRSAVSRLQLPWIQVFQPEDGTITATYSVTAYPTKVVINPKGKIVKIYSGDSPTFKDDVAKWLK